MPHTITKSAEKPRHSCRGWIGVGRAGLNAQAPNKTHAVPEPSMGEGTAEVEAPAFMPGRMSHSPAGWFCHTPPCNSVECGANRTPCQTTERCEESVGRAYGTCNAPLAPPSDTHDPPPSRPSPQWGVACGG